MSNTGTGKSIKIIHMRSTQYNLVASYQQIKKEHELKWDKQAIILYSDFFSTLMPEIYHPTKKPSRYKSDVFN